MAILTPEQIDKIEDDDAKFAFARVPWRTYIYKSREAAFKGGADGKPPDEWEAKRVYDCDPSMDWVAPTKSEAQEFVILQEGEQRRVEWRVTFIRNPRGIKRVQVHVWGASSGRPYKDRGISIPLPAIPRLLKFFQFVLSIPNEEIKHKARFEDEYVNDLVARVVTDERAARDLNKRYPELLQALIKGGIDLEILGKLLTTSGSANVKSMLAAMVKLEGREAILRQLADSGLSEQDISVLTRRREQVELFNNLLHDDELFERHIRSLGTDKRRPEQVWQNFLEKNRWIFGYGLSFRWLSGLDGRPLELTVVGSDIFDGKGVRMDAVLRTRGILSSICFVEIKHHKTRLMSKDPYRGEAWVPSKELAGGVAQVQRGVWKTLRKSPWGKLGVQAPAVPKSILVIGSLAEFQNDEGNIIEDRYRSFELYRGNIRTPEIITFDELHERCRHIVSGSEDRPPSAGSGP